MPSTEGIGGRPAANDGGGWKAPPVPIAALTGTGAAMVAAVAIAGTAEAAAASWPSSVPSATADGASGTVSRHSTGERGRYVRDWEGPGCGSRPTSSTRGEEGGETCGSTCCWPRARDVQLIDWQVDMELSKEVEAVDPRHSAEVEAAAVCPRRGSLARDLLDGAELQSLGGEVQLGPVAAKGCEAIG